MFVKHNLKSKNTLLDNSLEKGTFLGILIRQQQVPSRDDEPNQMNFFDIWRRVLPNAEQPPP